MIAFVFPGQGAQYVGMGVALAERYPAARHAFDEASAAIEVDLLALCRDGPDDRLRQTANTQPAILACSWAAATVLADAGIRPAIAAGLSLGEYTALVAAGALTYADAVRLVHARGRFMQEAGDGRTVAMAAVLGLPSENVAAVCLEVAGFVELSNFNAPGQTVIAGDAAPVEIAAERLRASGARRVVRLQVSAPFHTSLMRPAAARLDAMLQGVPVRPGRIPVIANVSAQAVGGPEDIRRSLVEQVASPVKWEQSVRTLRDHGATVFVEAGPGTTLAGLVRRTLPDALVVSADSPDTVNDALARLAAQSAAAPRP